jgi:hypothetical protein
VDAVTNPAWPGPDELELQITTGTHPPSKINNSSEAARATVGFVRVPLE